MKKITTLLFILLSLSAFCQKVDTSYGYIDYLYRRTENKQMALQVITLTTHLDDGNLQREDFHPKTGKILQRYYLSASDTSQRIGPYKSFYASGKPWWKGSYKEGRKIGPWTCVNEDGKLTDSAFYNDAGNITGSARGYSSEGYLSDSAFYHPDSLGRAYKRLFYSDGKTLGEGPVQNEYRQGKWTYFYPSGKISAVEVCLNDSVRQMTCYEEDGSLSKGECIEEIEAEFPGGLQEWQKYIVQQVTKKSRVLEREEATGTAWVNFIIGADGKITDAKIYISSGTLLDKYALEIVKNGPAWKPAKQHNRFVKAYRRQPISFVLQ